MMTESAIQMSESIRVKIAPQFKSIYNALKNHAVGDFHELFFICVCLGHKTGQSEPLKKGEDCFISRNISADEWYAYYAIYLHDHETDFSYLGDDKTVIEAIQDYANGGMAYLIDEFLCDYTKKDSSGNYIVDHLDQLPKELLVKLTLDWSY